MTGLTLISRRVEVYYVSRHVQSVCNQMSENPWVLFTCYIAQHGGTELFSRTVDMEG